MRQTYLKISFVFFTILLVAGCGKNRYEVDLTGLEADIELIRFEDRLVGLSEDEIETGYEALHSEHELITEALVEQIIGAGRASSPNMSLIRRFCQDTIHQQIVRDVQKAYPDVSFIEADLEEAFKRLQYYFPNDTVPTRAYTVFTRFAGPGFTYAGIVGVSLDWYMGQDYKYYHPQMMPEYMQRRMTREYITPQVIKGYFTNKYPIARHTDGTLLSEMIYYGRMLEFTKMLMPHLDDATIIEYTGKNLEWCIENEALIFGHFVEKKLFFSTDHMQTSRYVSDGPYTVAPDVPIESAPRLGWWIGWNIVKGYIENEGLEDADVFFGSNDFNEIFKKSRYKPE